MAKANHTVRWHCALLFHRRLFECVQGAREYFSVARRADLIVSKVELMNRPFPTWNVHVKVGERGELKCWMFNEFAPFSLIAVRHTTKRRTGLWALCRRIAANDNDLLIIELSCRSWKEVCMLRFINRETLWTAGRREEKGWRWCRSSINYWNDVLMTSSLRTAAWD